ncbi:MAG: hypothetical protein K8U03_15730 [Planctomycetia bacterium]|nr:hypothetical protein [Planctomycetia bacterium]
MPRIGGERKIGHGPQRSPLPEIEILPPPQVDKQRSKKRSSKSKRERSSVALDLPPAKSPSSKSPSSKSPPKHPPLTPASSPLPPLPPPGSKGADLSAMPGFGTTYIPSSTEAAGEDEFEEVQQRLRKVRLRKTIMLVVVASCMVAMSSVAYLFIRAPLAE